MASEENEYVAQLREVFDSCDSSGAGYLDKNELIILCQKLQLEDQTQSLVDQLIGDAVQGRVGFDEFKESFVSALSSAVDDYDLSSSEDEEVQPQAGEEVPAKYVKGKKKYGRRSKPDFLNDTDAEYPTDFSDTDFSFASPIHTPAQLSRSRGRLSSIDSEDSVDGNERRRSPLDASPGTDSKAEMFEAEGVMNQSLANAENALDPVSEEEHLRSVWKELGVGRTGYLVVGELAKVCEHIGMDEMNRDELQHLFDKLDVDQDGRVSFEEFLHGLFQHGAPNPPTPQRPLSAQKQKLRLTMTMEDRLGMQTPSLIAAIAGSGIFSSLDHENTGYATTEQIVELFESLGIDNGVQILELLNFDLTTKISLQELSLVLEQELYSADEDNKLFQTAIACYQHELKYVKSLSEQVGIEKDKLKTEVAEANQRNSLLIKEADERHSNIEKAHERRTKATERKYQDQIKTLQTEIDEERELMTAQAAKQKHKLEMEIDSLKDEETKLREKTAYQLKEIERLEKELHDMTESCVTLEKENYRQKRELDNVADLHRKLEEMESNRDLMNTEQRRFASQKLKQFEDDNKVLRDKNDELTMELESLKQENASIKKRRRRATRDNNLVKRNGSVLSDYQKPDVNKRRNSGVSSTENSDDDDASVKSTPGPQRRRLPLVKKESDDIEVVRLKTELDKLRADKDQQMKEVRQNLDQESHQMEQAFKQEITDMVEAHEREKEGLLKEFQNEKKRLKEDFENKTHELIDRLEDEKNTLEERFAEEKVSLTKRLHAEFEDEVEVRVSEVIEKMRSEKETLERSFQQDQDRQEEQTRDRMNRELRVQREKLQKEFEQKEKSLQERFDLENTRLKQSLEKRISDYENMFNEGAKALRGKLKDDFYELLDSYKKDVIVEEKAKLVSSYQSDREELNKQFERQKVDLSKAFTAEKEDLKAQHERELKEQKVKLEKSKQSHSDELDSLQQRLLEERQRIKAEQTEKVRSELEDGLVDQVERIREAFNSEKEELLKQVHALEDENMMLRETDQGLTENHIEIDRLNREVEMLRDENDRAEDTIDELKDHLQQVLEENNDTVADLEEQVYKLKQERIQSVIDGREETLNTAASQERAKEWQKERASLKEQLKQARDKLLEANANLTLAQSQHFREKQFLIDRQGELIDLDKYEAVLARVRQLECNNGDLERALESQTAETTKLLLDTEGRNELETKRTETEMEELRKRVRLTQSLLNEQMEKSRAQLEKLAKFELLCKDLYIENAELMKAMYVTEKRQKEAERTRCKYEEKCHALQGVLGRVSRAALG